MVKDSSDKPVERPVLRAILNAKKKFGPLLKDKNNPFYKSKYADLAALMDVVEGPLLEEDVVILQPTIVKPEGQYVRTRLVHVPSGDEEPGELKLPENLDAQKVVAAITYYKRATLQALLSIPSRDDDGETASGRGEYNPNHPTAATKAPEKPQGNVIPGFGKQPKTKEEKKPEPDSNKGLASVNIRSIAPGNHPSVKFSKLETSVGTFVVMGDNPNFTQIMKDAQGATLSQHKCVIESHVNAKGSSVVDSLRMEG